MASTSAWSPASTCRCSGARSVILASRSTRWSPGPSPAPPRASCRSRRRVRRTRSNLQSQMIRPTLVISNKLGLHARASAKLTKLASSFKCEVFMTRNTRRVNAKSIMGIMMLDAGLGSEVELETEGEDELQASEALKALVNDKFGEGQ